MWEIPIDKEKYQKNPLLTFSKIKENQLAAHWHIKSQVTKKRFNSKKAAKRFENRTLFVVTTRAHTFAAER